MNNKPVLPAYQVEVKELSTGKEQPSRSFSPNPFLFTARQAAFQYAQLLVAKKAAHEGLDITIKLVEYDRTKIPNTNTEIATVLKQQFPAQLNPDVLTIDVTLNDEAFNSPKALWSSLGEMTCEYEYYTSYDHNPGFGYLDLALSNTQQVKPNPYSSFQMLFDGLAYAASLVSGYNEHYAARTGKFSISPTFLPQQ